MRCREELKKGRRIPVIPGVPAQEVIGDTCRFLEENYEGGTEIARDLCGRVQEEK